MLMYIQNLGSTFIDATGKLLIVKDAGSFLTIRSSWVCTWLFQQLKYARSKSDNHQMESRLKTNKGYEVGRGDIQIKATRRRGGMCTGFCFRTKTYHRHVSWIILCGSSGDVTRLDGSEIGCQPHIFVFHRFSSLLLPLHPSLFWRFVWFVRSEAFPPTIPIYIFVFQRWNQSSVRIPCFEARFIA